MDAASVPRLPASVSAETLLPFSLWRVASLVDGQRTLGAIAGALGTGLPTVTNALREIERELGLPPQTPAAPAADTTAVVLAPDDVVDLLVDLTVEVMGPMGEVIVEDVVDELGEGAGLLALAERVAAELREPQRSAFIAKVRSKGLS
ncbi:hypothetical protein [Deinococcus pimensis]|uniref:hypothetical protein n=1 Tax=Deinococcus pimensis TaxID=309888 RepID=UPI0004823B27|nr:hypothetical protein [Deinococcus pimensis]